ncbi:MAG: hypothetical protein EAZ53_12230 [Bacteroidetes bacterium]|nr:MAG: hypothetical protein EAZ53_12230 [Bacteroidota bacterium]
MSFTKSRSAKFIKRIKILVMTVKLNNKHFFKYSILFILLFCSFINTVNAQKNLGIGTDKPDPKAVLELNVENPSINPQGLLLPRLTTAQRTALASGTIASLTGMAVYDLTDKTFYTWDGTQWKSAGTLSTTIVGTNGIVISTSGNSFTVDGSNLKSQWISASSSQIYTNSFVGIGTNNPLTALDIRTPSGNTTINVGSSAIADIVSVDFLKAGSAVWGIGAQTNNDFYISRAAQGDLLRIREVDKVIELANIGNGVKVNNNLTTTGIGYFGTIIGSNLAGAAGSIVTVDGLGKLGFGTLTIPQSQWLTTTAGIYYSTSVGIGMLPITNTGLSVKNATSNDGNVNGVLLDIAHGGNAGSKSGLLLNYNISGTNTSIFRSVLTNVTGNSTSSNPVSGNAVQMNVGGSANITGFETSIPSTSTGTKMGMNINVSGSGGSNNTGLNVNVSNGTVNNAALFNGGNVGIGTTSPNERLVVVGNQSTTGIGYFSSISGLALNGAAAGSIVTVDGVGKLGFGTLTTSTNYFTLSGTNIRTLNNSDNIQLASTAGAYMIGTNTGIRMSNFNSISIGNAGNTNTTGPDNNFIGFESGLNNLTGDNNNFLGKYSGRANTTGFNNNFLGISAGMANISGNRNNFFGDQAGFLNTSGSGNNFLGSGAGNINTSGNNNIFIGITSGNKNTTGNSNIGIGINAGPATNNLTNAIAIGANATATGSNQISLGANITGLGINTNAPTAMLDVNGGARIRNLNTPGSVITVDGQGNLGLGTLPVATPSQWLTTTAGIYYSTSVGIGMLPQTATGLSIKSAGNATKPLRILNSATSNPMFEIDEGSGGMANVMIYNNAGVLVNQIGGTLPSFFNGGGSVGIGTNAPTQGKLVVVEDAGTRPGIFVSGGGATSSASISIGRNTTSDGGIGVAGSALTTLGIATIGDFVVRAETRDLILSSKNNTGNIRFGTGNLPETEKMTILNNGNVGIGVVAPSEKLTIMGNQSTTGIGYFSSISGLALNGALPGSIVTVDGVGRLGFGTLAAAANYWEPNGASKIYTNSFVGIGNSNPTYPLHIVVGNTNDNAVFVNKNVTGTTGNQVAYSANFNGIPTSGMKIGYESNITPTAQESVRGMSSSIINSVSVMNLTAAYSYINNDANGQSVAFRAENGGIGAGNHMGFSAFDNSNGSAGQRFGVHSELIGTGATATNYAIYGKATGAGANNYAGYFDDGNVYMKDNVVIGNLTPTAKLDITGTIRFRNFTNGILTVDGTGLVGVGTMPTPNSWKSTTSGITFTDDKIAIGTSTVAGAARFKVAGDGSMGGMVITSQSLVNPISTSNTIYTTLITVPVYIPQGTNTIEFNVIGSSQGGGNIDFQLDVSGNTSAPISMTNTTPTIGTTPQTVSVASVNGWQTIKINVANSAGNTSAILHGYTVIVKN